jgi:hypothetical protein
VGHPTTMVTPNQQHIFYRDSLGAILHIFFDETNSQLFRDNWTQEAGAPAAVGAPVTMVTDHQQHVFYRDGQGAIHHIVADDRRQPHTPLFHDNWTQKADAPAAVGDAVTMVTGHQQHIFYRDSRGAIHHILADDQKPNTRLFHDQWTRRTDVPAVGNPVTMVTDHQQHIFYRNSQGAIRHIFFDEKSKRLFYDQWTQKTDTPAVGDPVTMVTGQQQHIFYRDGQGAIPEPERGTVTCPIGALGAAGVPRGAGIAEGVLFGIGRAATGLAGALLTITIGRIRSTSLVVSPAFPKSSTD